VSGAFWLGWVIGLMFGVVLSLGTVERVVTYTIRREKP
jgi:hypothetical protein